ncbi:MAG: glycoside hydrolase family 32 protein, partial [Verrucomicrobiaceae bacterium]
MNPFPSILSHKAAGICAGLFLAAAAAASAAGEPYRPQFHFTPERNWLNDPNGLVYYAGEYHMFFQYNPFGIAGANKSWGHAVSRDLVRWEELPVAIQVANGVEIFSGSAVIDWENTSGFQTGSEPPMIAIYTGAGAVQDQRIAYSNDRGRTWTNYSGNPVINIGSNDFRDPKVFWHEPTGKWVMVVCLPGPRK